MKEAVAGTDSKKKSLELVEREVRERLGKWVAGTPYRFNPETSIVDTIIRGIAIRKIKAGAEYCPCRVLTGDVKKDARVVCPCVFSKAEIENDGICLCHLFVGPNYKG
jgi:ferredoxin-thioredoxin reductase catalytic subunit